MTARNSSIPSSRRLTAILATLLLIFAVATFVFGQVRPIDADEGFYAAAAGLVSDGLTPYGDFFYPQGPVLPYFYGGVVKVLGHHLATLRLGSSLLAVLAVVPWLLFLARTRGDRPGLAITAALVFLLDPHLMSWNVTVKTFAFCNATVAWGLFACWRGMENWSWRWLAFSGAALGLCVGARTLYAPLVAVLGAGLVIHALRNGQGPARMGVGAFVLGLLLGTAPLLAAWLRDADLFWFNNLTCHQIRFSELRSQGLGSAFLPRASAALEAAAGALLLKPYRLLMLVLTVTGWFSLHRSELPAGERSFQVMLGVGTGVFFLANLLPDPVQAQYLTGTLGVLMLPGAVLGLAVLQRKLKRLPVAVILLLAVPLSWHTLLVARDGVDRAPEWTWDSYRQVCALLEKHTQPGDTVASFWPGYVFETGRRHVPGMENHFAIGVSEALDARQRRRYHIIGRHVLEDMFAARRPRAVVLGVWMNEINTALDDAQMTALLNAFKDHYCLEANVGRAKLALPCAQGGSGTLSD